MSSRRVESFLLRLVVQDAESIAPDQWRGRIQHITTGCEHSVEQLQDIVAFISTHLGSGVEVELTPVTSATNYVECSSPPRKAS